MPFRTCVGCQQRDEQMNLVRWVAEATGRIKIDRDGRQPGRRPYVPRPRKGGAGGGGGGDRQDQDRQGRTTTGTRRVCASLPQVCGGGGARRVFTIVSQTDTAS